MVPALVILLFVITGLAEAQHQVILPVLRQSSASSSTVTQIPTKFKVHEEGGHSYVLASDAAAAFGGQLRWRSASEALDLTAKGHAIRFGWNSRIVLIDKKEVVLDHATI